MSLKGSISQWRQARQTAYELNRLSERELEDIGMNRGDIPSLAIKTARSAKL